MNWSLIGTIGGKFLDIVDDVVEDKGGINRLKFKNLAESYRKLIQRSGSSAKIALAETLPEPSEIEVQDRY